MIDNKYPIKPRHVDTSKEPKGFDNLLGYDQIGILWSFFQFWQYKRNWEPFTHEQYIAFISDSGMMVNSTVRSGLILFIEPKLKSILDCAEIIEKERKSWKYQPTHYLISTYFLWNPAQKQPKKRV